MSDHCVEKGITNRYTPTNGGLQNLAYIDERNLYRLVMRSKLPSAEKFQDWVCGEVLPSIRKTGKYATNQLEAPKSYKEAVQQLLYFRKKFVEAGLVQYSPSLEMSI